MMFQIVGFHQRGFFALIGGKLIGVCKGEFMTRNDAGVWLSGHCQFAGLYPANLGVANARGKMNDLWCVLIWFFQNHSLFEQKQIDHPMDRNAPKKVEWGG